MDARRCAGRRRGVATQPQPRTLLARLEHVWGASGTEREPFIAAWRGEECAPGVSAPTVVYLDQAFDEWRAQRRLLSMHDVDGAVREGAAKCLRPMVMTVATTVLALLPLLSESGVGADLSARTAAPVVGGLASCMFLTLMVVPAAYTIWRRHQFRASARSLAL